LNNLIHSKKNRQVFAIAKALDLGPYHTCFFYHPCPWSSRNFKVKVSIRVSTCFGHNHIWSMEPSILRF
jgi:hypothetical protein